MKRNVLLAVAFFVSCWLCVDYVVAQPEVRSPNPAYLNWEDPCPETPGLLQGGGTYYTGITFPTILSEDTLCYVNSFGGIEKKYTIYGMALCITNSEGYQPIDRTVTLDVRLYNFTPGDSVLQLLKSQTFQVEQGRPHDLIMVYKNRSYLFNPTSGLDSLLKYPMYELYFDSPIDVDGYFFMGLASNNSFTLHKGMLDYPTRQEMPCCQNGYEAGVDTNRNRATKILAWCYSIYNDAITEYGLNSVEHYGDVIMVPQPDTVYTLSAQGVYPILRPKGYLAATEPTAEKESVQLLPNPARTKVTVEATEPLRTVDVMDMAGRNLLSKQCMDDATTVVLDIATLPQGSYVVRVRTVKGETTLKLLVE